MNDEKKKKVSKKEGAGEVSGKKVRVEKREEEYELFRGVVKNMKQGDLQDYVTYLHSPWRIIWTNFLAGITRGFGFIIGATVLVSIAVYFFINFLVNLPWVGDTFQWINENVKLEEIQDLGNSLGKLIESQEKQVELLEKMNNNNPSY